MPLYPGLGRSLAAREGRFNPFTYSIGLDLPFQDSLAAALAYPLDQPISDETVARFNAFVTFLHEAVHLAQYLSCSFGLRTLRRTLIALRYLAGGEGWDLPVATSLFARVETLSDYERRALHRFFAFLESFDQLQLHVESRDETGEDGLLLTWWPWTAYFHVLAPHDPSARPALAAELEDEGVLIHRLPHIALRRSGRLESAVVNGALLMENFAVLLELNQVENATGKTTTRRQDLLDLVPSGHGYTAAIEYALSVGACDQSTVLHTVAVCIDAALMYDPFVLYDAPSIEQPAPGQHADRFPGQTFVEACKAATSLRPIDSHTDVGRFYADLCEKMAIPSPDWMATRASEVSEQLLSQIDDPQTAWLGTAVNLHAEGLRERLKRPGSFCSDLLTSDGIFDVIDHSVNDLSFFDLRTRQPERWRNMDLLTLHNLLQQSLVQEQIDCPLKQGEPFYCDSALADANTLCVFEHAECQLDIFERECGLRPGGHGDTN